MKLFSKSDAFLLNRKLVWAKWTDPMSVAVETEARNRRQDPAYRLANGDDEWTDAEIIGEPGPYPVPGPAIAGPMGIIPIHEGNVPATLYNFWILHTNFNIGEAEKEVIEDCDGVESLDIWSRYRMRIGFGKAFDDTAVKTAVQDRLRASALDEVQCLFLLRKQLAAPYYVCREENGFITVSKFASDGTSELLESRI